MGAADLVLDAISKTYATSPAVNGISLGVEEGQFLSLLGPSGCGKTTLLRIVGGFVAPSGGRIFLQGKEITGLPPQQRPTAMVFQNYALFPHMTVAENIAFGLKIRRRPKSEIEQRVKVMLDIVSLATFGDRYPSQLSGGQQQRVALARALAVEPPVLLLDEPLGALDAKLREEMQFELCEIQRRLGITMIYVTHDQEEAFNMSDRVGVMHQGRILQVAAPDEIYRRPTCRFVAEFVGRSNVLCGVVGDEPQTMKTHDGLVLKMQISPQPRPGTAVAVILRPEDMTLGRAEGTDNTVEGTVEHRRLTGGSQLYYVRIGPECLVIVEDRSRQALALGEHIPVSWRSDHAITMPDAQ